MYRADPYELPNVEISGALALALVDVVDYARHRAGEGTAAYSELGEVREALVRDIGDAFADEVPGEVPGAD